jgi:hypothetical protein
MASTNNQLSPDYADLEIAKSRLPIADFLQRKEQSAIGNRQLAIFLKSV